MSGRAVFAQLRQSHSSVKVLLASGYSINGQAQEIMGRGCNGFIRKLFRLEQSSRRVREMLD